MRKSKPPAPAVLPDLARLPWVRDPARAQALLLCVWAYVVIHPLAEPGEVERHFALSEAELARLLQGRHPWRDLEELRTYAARWDLYPPDAVA